MSGSHSSYVDRRPPTKPIQALPLEHFQGPSIFSRREAGAFPDLVKKKARSARTEPELPSWPIVSEPAVDCQYVRVPVSWTRTLATPSWASIQGEFGHGTSG